MRIRRGQLVEVSFLDHCEGGGAPLEFTVWGEVLSIDKVSLTIASWVYSDTKIHRDPKDPDIKSFTILRSTVKSLSRMQRV